MVCLLDNTVTHNRCAVFLSPGVRLSFFDTPVFPPKLHNNIQQMRLLESPSELTEDSGQPQNTFWF